jgi:hypothetical protein
LFVSSFGSIKYCCSIAIPDLFFQILIAKTPEITSIIDVSRIPQKLIETELNIIEASFGFGDVIASS